VSYFSLEDAIKVKSYYKLEKSEDDILIDLNHLHEEQRKTINRIIINGISLRISSRSDKVRIEYIKKILKENREYKSFFSFFSNERKDDIISCFNLIEEDYRKVVYMKFGEDLSGKYGIKVSDEEEYIIYYSVNRIIKRMLNKLKNGYSILGIKDVYPEIVDLKKYIDCLPNGYKSYFYDKFGKNLDKKFLVEDISNVVGILEKKKLDEVIKLGGKRITPFYSYFKNYKLENETEEEFKNRIRHEVEFLDQDSKNILLKAYGEDFSCLYNMGVNSEEINFILRRIVSKIRYKLNGKDKNKLVTRKYHAVLFYNLFPPIFTPFEVTIEYSLLEDKYKEFIKLKYGENLDLVSDSIDEVTSRTIRSIIKFMVSNLYKRKSNYYKISINVLNEMNKILKSKEYKFLIKEVNPNIVFSVLCYLNIKDISIEDIINISGVNPVDSLEEVRSSLNKFNKLVKKY